MFYKINKDEKISDVMDKLDMPYELIWRYNPFVESKEQIHEGRVLKLPMTYSVLPGDTYESISKTFGIHPAYMTELNPYTDGHSIIYPGQTLFLPPEIVY